MSPQRVLLGLGLGLGLALTLLAACNAPPAPSRQAPATATAAATPWTYATELASARQAVADAEAATRQGAPVWPQWQALAEAQLALAKLTGDYQRYAAAAQSVERAFALAEASGPGQGPFALRAKVHFSLHRLGGVAADLARAASESTADPAALTGMAAELASAQGQHAAALVGYRQSLALREDLTGLVRLALWHARSGHRSEALALLDRAAAIYHGDSPLTPAWLALQRGLIALDRGEWDLAAAHYHHALRQLPGWWLAREHLAEIHALKGEHAQAVALYTGVIADTGHPEFMDALAGVLQAQGNTVAAAEWLAKARAGFDARLAVLPEAAIGHALGHYLQHASAADALALARRGAALRPNVESQLALAQALLKAGQAREALPLVRSALGSGWNTAELHAVAAQVLAANGLAEQAATEAKHALALNPRAAQQYGLP